MTNIFVIDRIGYDEIFDGVELLNEDKLFYVVNKSNASKVNNQYLQELNIIDSNDFEEIERVFLDTHTRHPIDHVIALSEKHQELAGKFLDIIKGVNENQRIAKIFRDKVEMKKHLSVFDIRVPEFGHVSGALSLFEKYGKIVIKPLDGMGSENIHIIDNKILLLELLNNPEINNTTYECEEFIDGELIHIDSVVIDGEIKVHRVSLYSNNTADFNEYSFWSSFNIDDDDLSMFNSDVIKAMGLVSGVTHLEVFRKSNGEIVFCEIAKRAGGAGIVDVTEIVTGVNLRTVDTSLYLSRPYSIKKQSAKYSGWLIAYGKNGVVENISTPEDFNDDWIAKCEIKAALGELISEPKFSTDEIAQWIVTGDTQDEVSHRINDIKHRFILEVN